MAGEAGVAGVYVCARGGTGVVSVYGDAGTMAQQTYEIEAAAIDGLGEYREGYELIDHRDLEVRYLYREATHGGARRGCGHGGRA